MECVTVSTIIGFAVSFWVVGSTCWSKNKWLPSFLSFFSSSHSFLCFFLLPFSFDPFFNFDLPSFLLFCHQFILHLLYLSLYFPFQSFVSVPVPYFRFFFHRRSLHSFIPSFLPPFRRSLISCFLLHFFHSCINLFFLSVLCSPSLLHSLVFPFLSLFLPSSRHASFPSFLSSVRLSLILFSFLSSF